ncbi:MAG: SDR family NAD(P)-dependent oxidoreductase, partial [Bradyrhizobium sp.]
MSIVLVTGGSGFLGSRCVRQLIEEGHDLRVTIRSPDREQGVRAMLGDAGAASIGFHVADLRSDDGWTDAVEGCDFVLHVASPFP